MADNTRAFKLLERIQANHAAGLVLINELAAELNQAPTPGQHAARLLKVFGEKWALRYKGQKYIPVFAKDTAILKRLVGRLAPAEIERRMAVYFTTGDPFYANARHPLTLFASSINKFNPIGAGDPHEDDEDFLASAPTDCRHTPACKTDEACTTRKARELRDRAK